MAESRFPNLGSIPEFLAALASPEGTHGVVPEGDDERVRREDAIQLALRAAADAAKSFVQLPPA